MPNRSRVSPSYVLVDGQTLHYRQHGDGTPLILLHQSPRSSRMFTTLMPELSDYHTVAFDTPGFGESDCLRGEKSIESLASVLARAIEGLKLGEVDVFGFHTGNKIAAALASQHPQIVRSVIVCGQPHSLIATSSARNDAIANVASKRQPEFLGLLRAVGAVVEELHASGDERPGEFTQQHDTDCLIDLISGYAALESIYAAIHEFDFTQSLKNAQVPVGIIEILNESERASIGSQSEVLKHAVGAKSVKIIEPQVENRPSLCGWSAWSPSEMAYCIRETLQVLNGAHSVE